MKAVVKYKRGIGFTECQEVPEPQVAPGMVKIKVMACGMCGSDDHIVNWGLENPTSPLPVPMILGHEYAGIVHEVGEGVEGVQVGDRVTAGAIMGWCGKCKRCMMGDYGACIHRKALGIETDGAMAEYAVVDGRFVFKLEDHVTFEEAAVTEPACVSGHAMLEVADIRPSDTVVIMGAGVIGLLALQFVKLCGATAWIVDFSKFPKRLELAKKFGADKIFETDKVELVKEVRALTENQGVDICVDCTGIAACVDQCILMTKKRGSIYLIGSATAEGYNLKYAQVANTMEHRLQNCYGHNWGTWVKVVKLIAEGKIDVKSLITHSYSYDQGKEAFEEGTKDPDKIKIMLHP